MDKEKVITVAIGLAVGVALAGLYFATVRFLPNFRKTSPAVTFAPPPAKQEKGKALIVAEPVDETSVKESPVTVSGRVPAGSSIIIFGPAEEKIASADASGNFSAVIKLEDGENEIAIASGDETVIRHVVLEISQ